MKLSPLVKGLLFVVALLILLAGVQIGYWTSVSQYKSLLHLEAAKTERLKTEYAQELINQKAEHAGKIRWLQNRQDKELKRIQGKNEAELQRKFREGLFSSCVVAFFIPDDAGYRPSYQTAVLQCNAFARTVWQSGMYDQGPPPDIDHNYIKGVPTGLESG